MHSRSIHAIPFLATLTLALGLAACDQVTGPRPLPPQDVGVVVNSVDNSLTVFSVAEPDSSFTIGLGGEGTPTGAAVAGELVVVPLGLAPAAAVVDLGTGTVRHTIALPQGSGATGVAALGTDSALVSNPQLNTISVLDLATGTRGAEVDVGPYPEAIVVGEDVAFVVNRHLGDDFQPTGTATISVLDRSTLAVTGTIQLSGRNPGSAVLAGDRLYVLHAGSWGAGDGSLSIVDTGTRTEIDHVEGFGNFPGSLTAGPDGRLYVASYSYGVAIWDPATESFVRAPAEALQPGGFAAVSDVGFDDEGRLYTLRPACSPGEPDLAFRLTGTFAIDTEITVGNCPTAIVFTEVQAR